MGRDARSLLVCVGVVALAAIGGSAAAPQAKDGNAQTAKKAQAGQNPPAAPAQAADGARPITPAEVRKMFDSYALMQAQEQVKISNEQFPKFLMQFKALQDLRRTSTQEHNRLLQDLRKSAADSGVTETQLKDKLKTLRDMEEKSHVDVRKAYEDIDKLLDVRQQARFRVFEQQMDQRMLQLVSRARQANRPKAVK